MRAAIIIGVFLCVSIAVLARKPDPVLRPYPTVFTAVYNRSDAATFWDTPRMFSVSVDLLNKRASITDLRDSMGGETWMLIFRPQGADPTSPASQGYTSFDIHSNSINKPPNKCLYATGSLSAVTPFPNHWISNQAPIMHVDTWFNLPNDLVYAGEYFITELGVMSDRWDSTTQCDLTRSGLGQVPCTSVMYSQGQNPVPLMDIRAKASRPHSFENDSYKVRVYHSFITSVSNSAFSLPNNWQTTCGNADNGFVAIPDYSISFYNNGESNGPLTIKLATPPIPSLGDVTVSMKIIPDTYYNCRDCITMGTANLTFNQQNWNVSQVWPIKFQHNGCSKYQLQATGGGYDWTYYTYSRIFYACEGTKEKGCVVAAKCGF